jgi:hypothetical protein
MNESNYIFPGGAGLYKFEINGVPELAIQLASLVVLSASLTGAGLSRGALYVSSSQQAKHIYGPVPGITLLAVHGVLAESNTINFLGEIGWLVHW